MKPRGSGGGLGGRSASTLRWERQPRGKQSWRRWAGLNGGLPKNYSRHTTHTIPYPSVELGSLLQHMSMCGRVAHGFYFAMYNIKVNQAAETCRAVLLAYVL